MYRIANKHNDTGIKCALCGYAVVQRRDGKYSDKKKRVHLECTNENCGKRTPGYNNKEDAIRDWNNGWGVN